MQLAAVYITPELLGEFCRSGDRHFRIEGGLPEDAKFVNAIFDYERKAFRIYFESESIPREQEGEDFPTFMPKATRLPGDCEE